MSLLVNTIRVWKGTPVNQYSNGSTTTIVPFSTRKKDGPGDNLPDDAHGLHQGVGEKVSVHRDGLALIDWLIDRLIGSLDWLIDWLVDRLIG